MAELLAIVALCEVILGSVRLHLDHHVAEGRELENLLRLLRSREGDKKEWELMGCGSLRFRPTAGHLLDTYGVEA
jgi:hypothetical protein